MLALIFIALAAVAKALCDTIQFHHDTSILKGLDRNFWDNSDWWHTNLNRVAPRRIFSYPLDGWHLSGSAMILCFLLVPFFSHPLFISIGKLHIELWGGYLYAGYGLWFNAVFNLFLNRIFRKKST